MFWEQNAVTQTTLQSINIKSGDVIMSGERFFFLRFKLILSDGAFRYTLTKKEN